jgi:CHAT domain-containing protein/tetratricopeptide repeat protein
VRGVTLETENSAAQPSQLLTLALSRPQEALVAARAVLAAQPSAYEASVARHAAAIVLRDRGDVAAAIAELRSALGLAIASGDLARQADVRATLGVALAWIGRSKQGLAALDQAATQARGAALARVLMRRASTLKRLGRYQEALGDLGRALPLLRRAGDTPWEARSLSHRAEVYLAFGNTARAEADFARAEELFARSGQELECAKAVHNRGLVAIVRGDPPSALAYLEAAGRRYDSLGATEPQLVIDRCLTLLAAGLAADVMREADAAAVQFGAGGGDVLKRTELIYVAAIAALSAADLAGALERAGHARRLFRAHGRDLWESRAQLVVVSARYANGERSARLLAQTERVASRLDELRDEEAPRAHLLAGRIALRRGDGALAEEHLERAARSRRRGSALNRSIGWLGQALRCEAAGNARATLAACARGLDALDEYQSTLGATELRAHATAHGAELALVAQREALRRSDPRLLLAWTERWRATALGHGLTTPPHDEDRIAELSALRAVTRMHDAAHAAGGNTAGLDRERRRLEHAVRARAMRTRAGATAGAKKFDLDQLIAGLGDTQLVELIEVDGTLHVITIVDRRVRRHALGSMPATDAGMARAVLARVAVGSPARHLNLRLNQVGTRLERFLLGPAADDLGTGPVVVIPPGRLHAVPWSLLPSLRNRVVSVAPSASTWLHAHRTQPPRNDRVTLIVGPGLETGGAEIPQLVRHYPGATVLGHGTATADNTLAALDGAWLAHIAAHGTFRADNPLFSSLRLDDGPLTVHDFERLRRAPYRLVLSSCDSGVAAPVGADELLGLVSSLIPLGAAGILASVVPVNDRAAVPLMVALHDKLQNGATLPEALFEARSETGHDPVSLATGVSFIALGA